MGKRKKLAAEQRKEARSTQYFARLVNIPSSPRKMRLVADMVRGMEVSKALIGSRKMAVRLRRENSMSPRFMWMRV